MNPGATVGNLQLKHLSKYYGSAAALRDISFDVSTGEFITLLGPSGSGKTTTLKIIAGFNQPDAGSVILDGKDVTSLAAHRRNIGMVFQNYALFPHLSVANNIAFPLEMRKVQRSEIARRVAEALELVHLPHFGERRPRQLSGGQQQRVALARALVFKPHLLLMDEPLGALDRKLREAMQLEIVKISRELGITVIYVTHDQEEALAMSHRIVIYNGGGIEQIGTPEEVYQNPASLFVATFVGESTTLEGVLERRSGSMRLVGDGWSVPVDRQSCQKARLGHGAPAVLVVRPEAIDVRAPGRIGLVAKRHEAPSLRGQLQSSIYLGTAHKHVIQIDGGVTAIARTPLKEGKGLGLAAGAEVEICWSVEAGMLLPPQSDVRQNATSPEGTASPTSDDEPGPARVSS